MTLVSVATSTGGTIDQSDRIPTREVVSSVQPAPGADNRPAFPLVSACVEPPAGIEPATPSLPWNHQEPLCGPPFSQVTPDRSGRSYRFSFGEVMCSSPSRTRAPRLPQPSQR
jgi:hypothetical protein